MLSVAGSWPTPGPGLFILPPSARDVNTDPLRRLSPNGFAAWVEVLHRGYEGMVAKDPDAPYVGGRTLTRLKVKQPKYREEERGFYKP